MEGRSRIRAAELEKGSIRGGKKKGKKRQVRTSPISLAPEKKVKPDAEKEVKRLADEATKLEKQKKRRIVWLRNCNFSNKKKETD
jgi:hypothetical protein